MNLPLMFVLFLSVAGSGTWAADEMTERAVPNTPQMQQTPVGEGGRGRLVLRAHNCPSNSKSLPYSSRSARFAGAAHCIAGCRPGDASGLTCRAPRSPSLEEW